MQDNPYEIEIDGEIVGYGIAPNAGLPSEPEDFLAPDEIDTESWRKYADVLDAKQIAWLFQNPQYLSRGTADFLLRRSKILTPDQIEWLKEHPDWDGAGDED